MEITEFNDERINRDCGSIYRLGILLATLFTLVFGAVRAVYLYRIGQLSVRYMLTEGAIVLAGAIILLIGFIRFPRLEDERIIFERASYYLAASKAFLVAALGGYALSIPYAFEKRFSDLPLNHLILVLEVFAYLYFSFSFKQKRIYFNYGIIELSGTRYTIEVLKRIGYIALYLSVPFMLALFIDLWLHKSVVNALSILLSYILSVVGLGAEYGILSLAEKINHADRGRRGLGRGGWVIVSLLIGGYLTMSVLLSLVALIVSSNMAELPFNAGEAMAAIQSRRLYVWYSVLALVGVLLSFIMERSRTKRMLQVLIRAMLIVTVLTILWQLFSSLSLSIANASADISQLHSDILITVNEIIPYIWLATTLIFTIIMIKEYKFARATVILPLAYLCARLAAIYFTSQGDALASGLLTVWTGFICVTVACILLMLFRGFESPEPDESLN